ncbi:hypothetical protein P7C71_g383, partial [Lecanoromycetidae sp. Uapishka_2]
MAATQAQANIWAQMAYVPPRGPCSQKTSMVSSCACYRFMIHPLKAATSFDCDGCGHHASFHRMQNPEDEEIARRWKQEEASREREATRVVDVERFEEVVAGMSGKRRRIEAAPEFLDLVDEEEEVPVLRKTGGRKGGKRKERE